MIFKRLVLEDFGLYGGAQTLELAPEAGRPVVLVGGTNGAGKTTILEAITLCLHGRRSLGPRVAESEYERYLRSRLHVADGGHVAESAAVTLVFEHAQSGEVHEYTVQRRFVARAKIKEQLEIRRDGESVTDVAESARQDFLDGLLPPGVAGLFLFDGEKIQALADDESGSQLAEAIRRLLGVDLVEQLSRDLRRLAAVSAPGEGSEGEELQEAQAALAAVESKLVALSEREASLATRRDRRLSQVATQQERVAQQGGALAAEREQHQQAAREASAEVAAAKHELARLVAGLLPFALAPEVGRQLAKRLEHEQLSEEARVISARLDAVAPKLSRALKPTGKRPVAAVLRDLLVGDVDIAEPLHPLSGGEREIMRRQLHEVTTEMPRAVSALRRRLVRSQERAEAAEALLAQIPEDDAVADIVRELQGLEREVGKLDGELARVEDERRQLLHEQKHRLRALERAEAKLKQSGRATLATTLALRTTALLDEFAQAVERRRLEEIAQATVWYFNRLSHKGEMLSRVIIDPETFVVSVRRWDETELPKERLSAGEKQLFAIAVLWALAKVSRRELPVVVDTPLARLDRDHRQRLLEQYFPEVSHQVVVLSTDTEVDVAAAQSLAPVTARQVWLHHDARRGLTTIEPGYFHAPTEAVG